MTPMDLHPEDLLEREIRGELSASEQERLELHARQCAVCRLERRAREDFRRDSESPAAEADVARLLAAMAGPLALDGWPGASPRAPKASPMRYVRFVSVAAAVVTMTGLAAAARWSGVRAVVMPWVAASSVVAPLVKVPPAAVTPRRVGAVPVPSPAPPVEAVEALAAVESQVQAPVAREAPVVRAAAAPSHRVRVAESLVQAPAAVSPVVAAAADVEGDATTLFREANDALRAGDHPRAGELYGALLNRYATAPEAHAALALFGRMLLDDGNANGALQCFDDYLRTGGALREDVMLGRALAFQRIGPRASADEARAWTSLIDAYPASVHAERARRRLFDLERL
jgi:TolA-binding protein